MNDLPLFLLGCFVGTIIIGAVGLLLYAAANEPGSKLRSEKRIVARKPLEAPSDPTPVPVRVRSSRIEDPDRGWRFN
jgi:hypothetical protein